MSRSSRNGKARGGYGAHLGASSVEHTEESLTEERERLIRERQSTVDEVLDRHDDLVRAKQSESPRSLLKDVSRCENCFT